MVQPAGLEPLLGSQYGIVNPSYIESIPVSAAEEEAGEGQ